MPTDCISYQNSGYFSKLIVDYLNQKNELESLYKRFPAIENFKEQWVEKAENFNNNHKRDILVSVLEKQYISSAISEKTKDNLSLLKNDNTFTITTGHQLNLFTGPLYFLHKIVTVINLTKELKSVYPDYHFVPVFWMATEDHDFEEINHFTFKGKKFKWDVNSKGPVGRLSTKGLEDFFEVFSKELGIGKNADDLRELFKKTYLEHSNLAEATRYLANELFKNEGLVILDGDDTELKKQFIPYIKDELLHQNSNKLVLDSIEKLGDYDIQVNPREINLFYIENELRERVIFEKGKYIINNTTIQFSEAEILDLVAKHPERFSPNVILRPLYQEVVLPNLAYIGGGGEIAYWLELKAMFDYQRVSFPILLVRNSVLLTTEKQETKIEKLHLNWADLFSKQADLVNRKVAGLSQFNLDFSEQKAFLQQQFEKLNEMVLETDKSFSGAVKAQEIKQLKGLANLEKRLLKAEKKKHKEQLTRITALQDELFPNQSLQERQLNFSEFYVDFGNTLLDGLKDKLHPLDQKFTIITL